MALSGSLDRRDAMALRPRATPEAANSLPPLTASIGHGINPYMPRTRWLNLELRDTSGEPLARRRYAIAFDDHAEQQGQLDGEGRLSRAVPEGAARASLVIAHRRLDLALVGLPEADTVEGAQERLNQLNFFVGNVDGDLGPFTATALRRFQHAHGLAQTGELDPGSVERLQREHGA